MNKQAFTFLTLFTLVLMLAVYYVTLPLDQPGVSTDDLIVSTTESDPIDSYQTGLNEKHNAEVDDNESVLSSKDSTLEDKLEALENISQTEMTSNLEGKIQQDLADGSFSGCFVEIEDEVTRIVCPKDYLGKENATAILSIVYESISSEDLVEVSFE